MWVLAEVSGLPLVEIVKLVENLVEGTLYIQRTDGSFEEAFPFESSYAVTGLVLSHYLVALDLFPNYFSSQCKEKLKLLSTKSFNFLKNAKETHGIISNHIMSTALSLDLYRKVYENDRTFTNVISVFGTMKSEGWFEKYDGADHG